MKSIRVKSNSIYEGPSFNEKKPFSGDDLLKSASSIVLRLRKHRYHMLNDHKIYIDDNSLSGETFHNHRILYNATSNYNYSEFPSIVVSFHEVWKSEADYKRMVTIDTSTAYKRGRRVPPKEMAFKVFDVTVRIEKGKPLNWLEAETQRLSKIADELDAATDSLSGWVESGLSMRIVCKGSVMCNHSSTIAGEKLKRLASGFASIEEFTAKLKCSRCGAKRLVFELGGSDEI